MKYVVIRSGILGVSVNPSIMCCSVCVLYIAQVSNSFYSRTAAGCVSSIFWSAEVARRIDFQNMKSERRLYVQQESCMTGSWGPTTCGPKQAQDVIPSQLM